jgi:tetratricopeptide (TPR) repeat protein
LADFYIRYQRFTEARPTLERAVQLAPFPESDLAELGQLDLALQDQERALKDFDRAEAALRRSGKSEVESRGLLAGIAAGRAVAYGAAQDWKRAIQYQREATRDTPEDPQQWQSLADIYQAAGETQLAAQARERVSALVQHH